MPARFCSSCKDMRGFVCRPCPACGAQKPADPATARRYGIEPGAYVTDEVRAAYVKRISAGKGLGRGR